MLITRVSRKFVSFLHYRMYQSYVSFIQACSDARAHFDGGIDRRRLKNAQFVDLNSNHGDVLELLHFSISIQSPTNEDKSINMDSNSNMHIEATSIIM